ncbi:MAG: hypothetical protein AAFS10_07095 [Myxococcota bacterium]
MSSRAHTIQAAVLLLLVLGCSQQQATGPSASSQATPEDCGPVLAPPTGSAITWIAIEGESDLALFVAGARQQVAGRMERADHRHVFRPTFPLSPEVDYIVHGHGCTTHVTFERVTTGQPPTVVDIYPRASTIPENVLRFYVYFSEPMAEGNFLDHIRLEDLSSGEDMTGVLFDNIHELWSTDRRRITLLVDPGRVKTGLAAHERLGRAFRDGTSYRLTVLPTWRSLDGRTLQTAYTKRFMATMEDRTQVAPSRWRLQPPVAGTRQPLQVDFGEPMDHVSVHRLLHVRSATGERLFGRWLLMEGERRATWTPDQPWSGNMDAHALVIHRRFEDIAGNNLRAAFDHRVDEVLHPNEEGTVLRMFSEQ